MLEKIFFLAGPEAAKNKDWSANAGFADLYAFPGGSYAEPIRAGLFEGLGDLWAAVAVRVALHNGENFSRRLALFRGRVHVVADGAKISRERGERNFRPDRAADKIGGTLI